MKKDTILWPSTNSKRTLVLGLCALRRARGVLDSELSRGTCSACSPD